MDQQAEAMSPPERTNEKLSTHFKERGLEVDTVVIKKHSPFHLREFPIDTSVGIMHFRPEGRTSFQPNKMSESLLFGIEGFQQLFGQIDQNQFKRPDYLYGLTNEKMAKQAEILGFRTRRANFVDPLDIEASLDVSGGAYEIVAETDAVRSKLEELLKRQYSGGKTIVDVLKERSTSQPSPKHLFRRLLSSLSMKKEPSKDR